MERDLPPPRPRRTWRGILLGATLSAGVILVLVCLTLIPAVSRTQQFVLSNACSAAEQGPQCGVTMVFGSLWNSRVTVVWTSVLHTQNPQVSCVYPNGDLFSVAGDSGSVTYTSSGGDTHCDFLDPQPQTFVVNVTVESPIL